MTNGFGRNKRLRDSSHPERTRHSPRRWRLTCVAACARFSDDKSIRRLFARPPTRKLLQFGCAVLRKCYYRHRVAAVCRARFAICTTATAQQRRNKTHIRSTIRYLMNAGCVCCVVFAKRQQERERRRRADTVFFLCFGFLFSGSVSLHLSRDVFPRRRPNTPPPPNPPVARLVFGTGTVVHPCLVPCAPCLVPVTRAT